MVVVLLFLSNETCQLGPRKAYFVCFERGAACRRSVWATPQNLLQEFRENCVDIVTMVSTYNGKQPTYLSEGRLSRVKSGSTGALHTRSRMSMYNARAASRNRTLTLDDADGVSLRGPNSRAGTSRLSSYSGSIFSGSGKALMLRQLDDVWWKNCIINFAPASSAVWIDCVGKLLTLASSRVCWWWESFDNMFQRMTTEDSVAADTLVSKGIVTTSTLGVITMGKELFPEQLDSSFVDFVKQHLLKWTFSWSRFISSVFQTVFSHGADIVCGWREYIRRPAAAGSIASGWPGDRGTREASIPRRPVAVQAKRLRTSTPASSQG